MKEKFGDAKAIHEALNKVMNILCNVNLITDLQALMIACYIYGYLVEGMLFSIKEGGAPKGVEHVQDLIEKSKSFGREEAILAVEAVKNTNLINNPMFYSALNYKKPSDLN